jgi:hypothetical protein
VSTCSRSGSGISRARSAFHARERACEPANRLEPTTRHDAALDVAMIPKAREPELHEWHRFRDARERVCKLAAHGVVFEREVVRREALVDHIGPGGSGERHHQLHGAGQRDAEPRLTEQRTEEIAARGDDAAQAGHRS